MERFETKIPGFSIRKAERADVPLILTLIHGLAEYEKMPDDVVTDEATLEHNLFDHPYAEVLIGEENGTPVGYALFFHNFSTFCGKPGLYLEDLFIMPPYRGKGYGSTMLACLAHIASERGCARFEWVCLDWNVNALKVYRSIGAQPQNGWIIQRMEGESIPKLAERL